VFLTTKDTKFASDKMFADEEGFFHEFMRCSESAVYPLQKANGLSVMADRFFDVILRVGK